MTNEQHTPGPYRIGKPGGPSGPFWSVINQDGQVVALQIPNEKDAQLIHAAPDLLAACEMAAQLAEIASDWNLGEVEIDGEMMDIYDVMNSFDAAIEKAKGNVTDDPT